MKKTTSLILTIALSIFLLDGFKAKLNTMVVGQNDRASQLLNQARNALGGEVALKNVKSITMTGKTRRLLPDIELEGRDLTGETTYALSLPNKFMIREKIQTPEGREIPTKRTFVGENEEIELMAKDPEAQGKKKIIIKQIEREDITSATVLDKESIPEDGEQQMVFIDKDGKKTKIAVDEDVKVFHFSDKHPPRPHHNFGFDLGRRTLGLLLQTPENLPVTFSYVGGVETKNGSADLIDVSGSNGFKAQLYLDSRTHLPVMLTYKSLEPIFLRINKQQGESREELQQKLREKIRNIEEGELKTVEITFSDHRSVDGIMLPFHVTKSVEGKLIEELNVEKYEVNPTNIDELFKNDEGMRFKIIKKRE
ncbi:MAG: hypothetical protein JNN15_18335 [Blastocatellia bacterium]|nr:hypothetical protein [Blastocatellia bacterium]